MWESWSASMKLLRAKGDGFSSSGEGLLDRLLSPDFLPSGVFLSGIFVFLHEVDLFRLEHR